MISGGHPNREWHLTIRGTQLGRQAGNMTNAPLVTTRVFTAAEQASNHCQLDNIGAVSRLIDSRLDCVAGSFVDGDAAARTPTPM